MVTKLWFLIFILFEQHWNLCSALELPAIQLDSVGGQLGFVGQYAGLSPYRNSLQFESLSTNSLITSEDEEDMLIFNYFANINGSIETYCKLTDTQFILAGNFNSINQTTFNNIARFDTQLRTFSPLQQGLDGPVNSVYCVNQSAVYVGGNFTAPVTSSSQQQFTGHVAIWNDNQWYPVPWKGFNGPVYSILPHQQQSILFAGQFDSTGDSQFLNQTFSQQINLISTATISEGNGAAYGNYSNPKNVLCSRAPWLLQDGVPGYWEAIFNSPIEPSVFRLSNARIDGRNTDSFNIISLGSNEYFELSYKDPVTNQVLTCSEQCYLSNDSTITYQDFTVLKPITTSGIRINIDTWYGSGGGLGGVSIFRSDVTLQPAPTIESDSQLNCYSSSDTQTSSVSTTGNWSEQYSFGTYRNFLTATIPISELTTSNISITYQPYVYAQGIYDVYITTPGCIGTSSCDQRTQVELSINFVPGNTSTYILDQNIVNDETTLIYTGSIAATTDFFKPTILMKVAPTAQTSSTTDVKIFGSSIQFIRNSTSSTLSSILNYYPGNNTWLALPQQLPIGSVVYSLQSNENKLYIGGRFNTNNTMANLVAYDFATGLQPLADGGLNGLVSTSLITNSYLIVGGSFNNTLSPKQTNSMNYVAIYDIQANTWLSLNQGVNGNVNYLYLTKNGRVHLSGDFNSTVNSNNEIIPNLYGNIEWDLSNQNWVTPTSFIVGPVANEVSIDSKTTLYLGQVKNAQTYRSSDVVSLTSQASSTNFNFNSSITQIDPDAVVHAGAFWKNDTDICLILAGLFHLSNTEYNLVIRSGDTWRGLLTGIQGEIQTLSVVKNNLIIGGQFNGTSPDGTTMTSIGFYDLEKQMVQAVTGIFNTNGQPGRVNAIAPQADGRAVFVGGNFTNAGLLDCSTLCMLTIDNRQWTQVQPSISGIINDMLVNESGILTVVGDLTIGGQNGQQHISLAELDTLSAKANWKTAPYNQQFLSPVGLVYDNDNSYLITGKTSNGTYIANWNGKNFTTIGNALGSSTNIRQLLWAPIDPSSAPSLSRYPANSDTMLMAVGHLAIPNFGSSSVALYDGTRWQPYLLTASNNGSAAGSVGRVFTATPCCTATIHLRRYMSVPAVILISIAISLGIIFLFVACAFLYLFFKRRNNPEYYYYSDPMKGWKPKYRPSSLLAMIDAAHLSDPATAIAATHGGSPEFNEKYMDNPMDNTVPASGYSTALNGGQLHAATHRGQTGIDMADAVGSLGPSNKQQRSSSGISTGAVGIVPFSIMMSNALRNSQPQGAATEESPQLYYAKYPFEAKEFGELAFDAHAPIVVTDTSDNVWWMGYKDDGHGDAISGLFPSNYVTKAKPI